MRERDDRLEGWVAYFDRKLRRVGEAATIVDRNLDRRIDGHDRRLQRLEEALLRPDSTLPQQDDRARPSQPPGATQSPDQGVGMVEGEKVRENGDTEVRGAERAVIRVRVPGPGVYDVTVEKKSSPLGLYSNTISLESDQPRVSWDGETDDTRAVQQILDERVGALDARQESIDAIDRRHAPCHCPSHGYVGPHPCPSCSPAPPPSAEPAEETSSGGERCGGGTAGGAQVCCLQMRSALIVSGPNSNLKRPVADLLAGWVQSFLLCPWCASPLREDGELRVDSQGRAETSNPRDSGDTLGGGEG